MGWPDVIGRPFQERVPQDDAIGRHQSEPGPLILVVSSDCVPVGLPDETPEIVVTRGLPEAELLAWHILP